MARVTITIPYVSWREGRPRFTPGPGLRRLGLKPCDLKRPDGSWMSAEEARAWIEAQLPVFEERRARKAAGQRLRPIRKVRVYTVEDLFEDWFKTDRMAGREEIVGKRRVEPVAPATLRDYRNKSKAIETDAPELWGSAAAALTKPIVYGLFEELYEERGLSMARGIIRVLSSALTWGITRGHVELAVNPCQDLQLETPAPRQRAATPAEIAHLVATADAIGRPELGDSILLGVWTGQRQGDRIALTDAGRDDDGRLLFRQSKTGALVALPPAPQLVARLAAARERRRTAGVAVTTVLADERLSLPWTADRYRKAWQELRAAAVEGIEGKVPPLASVADLRDQDMRDTAVTWLARAGCTVPQIAAVTGHGEASVHGILKHYLARHPELADAAIARMVAWFDRQPA